MDEERRQGEGYKTRLMEEHEVPEWVFLNGPKGEDGNQEGDTDRKQVTGKRARKEVMYTDVLSDSQWMKAIEDGEDVGAAVKVQLTKRSKRREQQQAALEQEVAEMLEGDENSDDAEDETAADAEDESITEHTELQYEEAEVKTTENKTRIVIKRRHHTEETKTKSPTAVKESSENRLRLVLVTNDKATANWKGLQRKRSRHAASVSEEQPKENIDHEGDETEDEDESM